MSARRYGEHFRRQVMGLPMLAPAIGLPAAGSLVGGIGFAATGTL